MSGCDTESTHDPADRPVRPPSPPQALDTVPSTPLVFMPNVYLVAADAGAQVAPDSVVIAAATALTPGAAGNAGKTAGDLVVGDFLVNDYGMSPSFALCITSLSSDGTTVTAATRLAGLDELFQSGSFSEVVPNIASGTGGSAIVGATLRRTPAATIPVPGFDFQIAFPTMHVGNVAISAKTGSHIAFDPDIDIGIDLGFLSVNSFHLILQGAVDGRLELDINASLAQASNSFEVQIGPTVSVPVPLPGTPLEFTANLQLFVGCAVNATASVDVDTGFTLTGQLIAGGHYSNGAWGADAQLPSFAVIQPTFSAGASLDASCDVRPHLSLLLFNAVGPFVDVIPSVYGDLAFTAPPPAINWDVGWTLTGQLGGTVNLPFHQFTLGPVTIFDIGKQQLAAGSYSPPSNYCNASSDCPSGQVCNSSHACVTAPPPPGGCNTNSDCATGQTCTNHVCVTPPPPAGDNCAHAANGGYCGFSTADGFSGQGASNTIYFCSNHRTTSTTHCSSNCAVAPEGQADFCVVPGNHCSHADNGIYCGFSTMDGFDGLGDARKLYSCSGHATSGTTNCTNTCTIAPPGQADTCSTCTGTVCGTRCCAAGNWCGTGNRCCSGCSTGCPC